MSLPPRVVARIKRDYRAWVAEGRVSRPFGGGALHWVSRLPPLRKTLQVKIVDDEEYEKKDNFFIELGQPQWLKRGISGEGE